LLIGNDLINKLSIFGLLGLPLEYKPVFIKLHLILIRNAFFALVACFAFIILKVDRKSHSGTFTKFALELDAASELFDDVFRDHESKANTVGVHRLGFIKEPEELE